MSSTRAADIRHLLQAVRSLTAEQRTAYLDREGTDAATRQELESLLRHGDATSTIAEPSRAAGATCGSAPEVEPAAASAKRRAPDPRLGRTVGRYRVVRELGAGGMGVVYLAVDDKFRRQVALKVLKKGMDTEDVLRRFERERQLLASLNHPGIARLYDAGETEDGVPFFVMEYVEGLDVGQYCDVHRLSVLERLELFEKICAAVHHAHQNLVVHRDLKPSNIIVTQHGQPKLLDFGIAKMLHGDISLVSGDPTAPELRVMTPQYASPEQVRGNPISTASDVYSLGVLLYELLSGHRPYRLKSRVRAELERVICEEEPERPSTAISRVEEDRGDLDDATTTYTITPETVSRTRESRPERLRRALAGDIDNIVLMAMRKEPQRRYRSAEQLAEDIQRHLAGRPVIARPDTIGYRATKFIRRNRAGVAAAAFIAISLVAGVVGTAWGWRGAENARQAEREQRQVAEVQRDLAERRFDHVRALARTFMFDFHDAIQTLDGSIPAREMLVTQALEYLDGLAAEAADHPELQRELASAYDRVGDIRGGFRNPSLGDTDGAMESYRAALAIRTTLAAAAPDDPAIRKDLSGSHVRIGDMLMRTGDVGGALDAHRQALRLGELAAEADPDDVRAQRDVAVALVNVGHALSAAGDTSSALAHYERSLAIRETVARANPEDPRLQRDVSVVHLKIGDRLLDEGDYGAAVQSYEAAIRIREAIAEPRPDSGRARRDLAVAHYAKGRAHLWAQEPEAAKPHLAHFLEASIRRARDNAKSARARSDLAIAHEMTGTMHAMLGEWDHAGDAYEAALAVIAPLAHADPANVQHQTQLAEAHERLAETQAERGDYEGAIASGSRALAVIEPVAGADGRDVRGQTTHARILTRLGTWLAAEGRTLEARRRLDAAQTSYDTLMKLMPEDAEIRGESAIALRELSSLMIARREGQSALAYAQRAVDLVDEPDPQLLRELAVSHELLGNRDLAIEIAEDALRRLGEVDDPKALELRKTLEADLDRYRQ